ncbi:hypothetical protein BLOT_003945 [Blomia tropicalis]|nr:hypothetical protein BLOT_003945 [Blomia tropicalis]
MFKISTTVCMVMVIACYQLSLVSACKCIARPDPVYCQTEWLALLDVKEVIKNETEYKKYYSYNLITDLSESKFFGQLKNFNQIQTRLETAACGVYLEEGTTYLVGGNFIDKIQRPNLFSCSAYWKKWDLIGEESSIEIEKIREECHDFHTKKSFC